MDIKNEVLYRIYGIVFGIVVPIAIVLCYRTVEIGIIEGAKWREKGQELYVDSRPVEAERGNIFAEDGSLLATSIPHFDIYMDPNSTGMTEADFNENIDSLAYCIATYVDSDLTVGAFRDYLISKRADSSRFVLIKKGVSFAKKKQIEKFPLFNKGRIKGGFIAVKSSERRMPFHVLARRTVGYKRDDGSMVGLEDAFDEVLGGTAGEQLMFRVDVENNLWLPVNDLLHVEPQSGDDIHTTIDINLQDITEEALMRAMNYHNAEWGTAMIMEVETGAIKAIANLGRYKEQYWVEGYNYAIGRRVEPGSTFKLASIMALLEDGYLNLDDTIQINKGKTEFYNQTMVDATPFSFTIDSTSIRNAFEISSNVGIATLVNTAYGTKNRNNANTGAVQFIKRLKDFYLNLPTGIEIAGEENPRIKEAYDIAEGWSGTSLPWMSIGYELELTPLQLLTFYNAVANDGTMMKPYLVTGISKYGKQKRRFTPTVIKQQIATPKTIAQAKELLLGVVERGTAYKLKTEEYRFAGKTGTAQVNYRRVKDKTYIEGYRASFAGYFPAENPKYSCLVMVEKPKQNGVYGGEVAGPVFREIADKCFATRLELHGDYNSVPQTLRAKYELPGSNIGDKEDFKEMMNYLDLNYYGDPESDFTALEAQGDTIVINRRTISKSRVPNVIGMGLRDAIFALENSGLKVKVEGVGKVYRQSLKVNTPARGQTIKISLK